MNETSVLAMNLHLGDRVRLPSGVSGEVTGLVANDLPVISFVDGRPDVTTRKTVMLINIDGTQRWHVLAPTDSVWIQLEPEDSSGRPRRRSNRHLRGIRGG